MTPIFDMDARARLPWRFYGANCTILAHLWLSRPPKTAAHSPC